MFTEMMMSAGGGGNVSPSYVLVAQTYIPSVGYCWALFYNTGDTYGYNFKQYGTGLDYEDDNIKLVNNSSNAFTLTFKKAAKLIYTSNKTEVNYAAGDTHTITSDNGTTNPRLIIME